MAIYKYVCVYTYHNIFLACFHLLMDILVGSIFSHCDHHKSQHLCMGLCGTLSERPLVYTVFLSFRNLHTDFHVAGAVTVSQTELRTLPHSHRDWAERKISMFIFTFPWWLRRQNIFSNADFFFFFFCFATCLSGKGMALWLDEWFAGFLCLCLYFSLLYIVEVLSIPCLSS